jgi:DNA uptake protein ComE-like DNA-binding protein
MKLFAIAITIVPAVLAFAPIPLARVRTDVKLDMATRRDAISEIMAAATLALTAQPAMAETVVVEPLKGLPADNEIVKEQRTVTDKLDINNAPVADYMQFPGMYPKIGGKIANGGPYGSVKDVYKLKTLSDDEIKQIKKYESKLTATPATGLDTLRGRDPYRRTFNK